MRGARCKRWPENPVGTPGHRGASPRLPAVRDPVTGGASGSFRQVSLCRAPPEQPTSPGCFSAGPSEGPLGNRSLPEYLPLHRDELRQEDGPASGKGPFSTWRLPGSPAASCLGTVGEGNGKRMAPAPPDGPPPNAAPGRHHGRERRDSAALGPPPAGSSFPLRAYLPTAFQGPLGSAAPQRTLVFPDLRDFHDIIVRQKVRGRGSKYYSFQNMLIVGEQEPNGLYV